MLKARDTWPRSARIYCHRFEAGWPEDAQIVQEVRVSSIRRRGPVIDLVLARPRLSRSQMHKEWCSFELYTVVVDTGASPLADDEFEE